MNKRFLLVLLLMILPGQLWAIAPAIQAQLLSSGVSPTALEKALQYLESSSEAFPNQAYLSLIDYSLPSTAKRYFLLNLKNGSFETLLVAHGRNSGLNDSTSFSNEAESYKSSLGFFRSGEVYSGKHGISLRLQGLSSTNSNAFARAIVIHGADYVSEDLIRQQGRIGRSLGCPALNPQVAARVIEQIKNGSLIYSFSDTSN